MILLVVICIASGFLEFSRNHLAVVLDPPGDTCCTTQNSRFPDGPPSDVNWISPVRYYLMFCVELGCLDDVWRNV